MSRDFQRKAAAWSKALPRSYVLKCAKSKRMPITADYAVWLVTKKGLSPEVVPGKFTTEHLAMLPDSERQRWLRTARRRHLAKQRRLNPVTHKGPAKRNAGERLSATRSRK